MSGALFKPVTDSEIVKLPTAQKPEHKWSDPVSRPAGINRFPQTERTCEACQLVKITVHGQGGASWREWRKPDSPRQWRDNRAPVCEVVTT